MTETSRSASVDALELDNEHLTSQTAQLWERAPLGFAATFVNALITIGILRLVVDADLRWGWLAVLVFVTLVRYVQSRYYAAQVDAGKADAKQWKAIFDWGIGVCGVVWGSSAIFLYADSVAHQTFLAFVLGGMVAGAAATFSTSITSFLAFSVPALSPLILRFVSEGDELHVAMGGMVLLFGVLLSGTAHRVSTLSAESFYADRRAPAPVPTAPEKTSGIDERSSLEQRYRTRYRLALHEQKHTSMSTFVRGVVERLSKPVHAISENMARSARYPILMERSPLSSDVLFRLDTANKELLTTIEQLAEIAIDAGGSFQETSLAELIESAINDWSEEHGYHEAIDVELAQVPPSRIDRRQCRIALRELLNNAREASIGSGREIRVHMVGVDSHEIEPSRAFVHGVVTSPRCVAISVSDGGVGIPAEKLERIFDPFYSTKDPNRGLGLTLVAGAVRKHNGEITVDSHPRHGTTVTIYLPVE